MRGPRHGQPRVACAVLAALVLVVGGAGSAGAAPRPPEAGQGWPVLAVILDGLDWAWIQRYALSGQAPNLSRLVGESALAVYNPMSPDLEVAGAYLTAAAGTHIEASTPVTLGEGERARKVLERRAGSVPRRASYYVLDFPRLAVQARESGSFVPPGWLAGALHRAGIRTVLVGDSAWVAPAEAASEPGWVTRSSPLSLAALLVADETGAVDQAYRFSAEDPGAAGGLRSRWERLPGYLRGVAAACHGCRPAERDRWLAVVASADLWRLRREEEELSPAAREAHHRALAARLDRVIGWWLSDPVWGRGSLLLFGAMPGPTARQDGELLTAMVWKTPWGPGVIYSATTRRAGFVTSLDLAPTLAAMGGVPVPRAVVGRPLLFGKPPPEPARLDEFARARAGIWKGRFRVMSALITVQVLALAAGLARVALAGPLVSSRLRGGWATAARDVRPFRLGTAWAAAVPLALLTPWVGTPPVPGASGVLWAITVACALALGVAWFATGAARRFGFSAAFVVSSLCAGVIACDLIFHLDLVARSFMGYDLIGGARFYGIGNEHMGLLLGSCLVAAAEAGERWPLLRPAITAALLGVAWLVGGPALGANVGGAIALATAFGAAAVGWHLRFRPDIRAAVTRAGAGICLAALLVAAAGAADLAASAPGRSHLARTLEIAHAVGPQYVASVAARKVALNWRLLRYSLYSRIAAVAMVVVMAAFWAPAGGLHRVLVGRPRLRVALEAAALGAAAALLANDSGVTAAAGALLGPAALVLELALAPGGGRGGAEDGPARAD